MEFRQFRIGKERIRPPDLVQHFLADGQFLLFCWHVGKLKANVAPVLTEVEIQGEVLENNV